MERRSFGYLDRRLLGVAVHRSSLWRLLITIPQDPRTNERGGHGGIEIWTLTDLMQERAI